jgi:hypothetical protein
LWIDTILKRMIAFELKTDKKMASLINKDEIGQGLNHLEWLRKQFADIELVGLIYLTEAQEISDRASPAANMYMGSREALRKVWDDFLAVVQRLRPKSQLERFIEAVKIGEMQEWSCEGLFRRIAVKKMS